MNRRQNQERDRRLREEFARAKRDQQKSREVIRDLADQICRSEKRIERIVYPVEKLESES